MRVKESKLGVNNSKEALTLKELRFSADSPFGASIVKRLKTVDDDSRFISADEFMQKYGNLLPIKNK